MGFDKTKFKKRTEIEPPEKRDKKEKERGEEIFSKSHYHQPRSSPLWEAPASARTRRLWRAPKGMPFAIDFAVRFEIFVLKYDAAVLYMQTISR